MENENKQTNDTNETIDCDICCETTTKRNNILTCIHCKKQACQNCVKHYILTSINDARCMYCEKGWNREFLIDCFSYTWVNGPYKKYRQEMLYDRQLSMLEDTMRVIEERKYVQGIKDKIKSLQVERDKLYGEINKINRKTAEVESDYKHSWVHRFDAFEKQHEFYQERADYYKKLIKFDELKQPIQDEIKIIDHRIIQLNNDIELAKYREDRKRSEEKFFGHCPVEDCKGFITQSWKCGICDTKVCRSCKEKVAPDYVDDPNLTTKENNKRRKEYKEENQHTCNEDTLLALKEIKSVSKPCPKCKVPIMKLSGCSQMWCTECHVTFCWRTGEIVVTGNIHNPHYFEWRAQNGNIEDEFAQVEVDPCNQHIPTMNDISYITGTRAIVHRYDTYVEEPKLPLHIRTQIHNIVRLLNHIQDYEIERYIRLSNLDMNLEYRVRFMKKEIDEKKFKQQLQVFEKRKEKYQEFCMIFEMLYNTARELFYQHHLMDTYNAEVDLNDGGRYRIMYDNRPRVVKRQVIKEASEEQLEKFIKTFEELRKYANKSFENLKTRFRNKVPEITVDEERHDYEVRTI